MNRRALLVALVVTAATPLAFASCAHEPPPGTMAATLAHEQVATQFIGPGGGSLTTGAGSMLQVPQGALSEGKYIRVTPSTGDDDDGITVGSRYHLEPDGTTFAKPVRVVLPIDSSRLPKGKTISDVIIYIAPSGTKNFTPLVTKPYDATHVYAETTHFTDVSPKTPITPPPGWPPPAPVPPTPPAPPGTTPPTSPGSAPAPANTTPADIATLPPQPAAEPATPAAGQKDWVCPAHGDVPEARFWTFQECAPKCLPTIVSRIFCEMKPTCPDLQVEGNMFETGLEQGTGAPNQVTFGPYLPIDLMQRGAVATILKTFFSEDPSKYRIKANQSADDKDWAQLSGDQPPFSVTVVGGGFGVLSPGALVSTIGHELIHGQQKLRKYTAPASAGGNLFYFDGFSSFRQVMYEYEAHSWETGQTQGDSWPGHKTSSLRCGTVDERKESQVNHDCYEWAVNYLAIKAAHDLEARQMAFMDEFLKQDPWAKIWLSQHADWHDWKTKELPKSPVYQYTTTDGKLATEACACDLQSQNCQ